MHADKMMGLVSERRVTIDERWWVAMKLALWRSKVAWGIVSTQADEIVAHAKHVAECEGSTKESAPCHADCPDRELRLSALVILNAARQFAPIDAKKAAESPYIAPSREYFSAVIAELVVCQAQLEACSPPAPPDKASEEGIHVRPAVTNGAKLSSAKVAELASATTSLVRAEPRASRWVRFWTWLLRLRSAQSEKP